MQVRSNISVAGHNCDVFLHIKEEAKFHNRVNMWQHYFHKMLLFLLAKIMIGGKFEFHNRVNTWLHYFHEMLFFLLAKMMIGGKFEVLTAVLPKVRSSGKFLCVECSVVSDISKDRVAFVSTLKLSK